MAVADITVAEMIVAGVEIYGLIGLGLAVAFLFFGLDRVDPAARDAYAFRPLLVPGLVVLWPLVLWRWVQLERMKAKGFGFEQCRRGHIETTKPDDASDVPGASETSGLKAEG